MKQKLKGEEPGVESFVISARDADERGTVHANPIRLADRSRRVHPPPRVFSCGYPEMECPG